MRYAHLYVYGFEPKTNNETIINYLDNEEIKSKVEKFKSKEPEEYSSFSVSVPFDKFDEVTKHEL